MGSKRKSNNKKLHRVKGPITKCSQCLSWPSHSRRHPHLRRRATTVFRMTTLLSTKILARRVGWGNANPSHPQAHKAWQMGLLPKPGNVSLMTTLITSTLRLLQGESILTTLKWFPRRMKMRKYLATMPRIIPLKMLPKPRPQKRSTRTIFWVDWSASSRAMAIDLPLFRPFLLLWHQPKLS